MSSRRPGAVHERVLSTPPELQAVRHLKVATAVSSWGHRRAAGACDDAGVASPRMRTKSAAMTLVLKCRCT